MGIPISRLESMFSFGEDGLPAESPVVLPSLLKCDFGNLAREVHSLEEAGVQGIHLDVMDGHFVPNLSFGLPIIEAVRQLTDLTLDVHLMVSNPEEYFSQYIDAGANVLTIHAEVVEAPGHLLSEIRSLGAAAGLAINPPTPIDAVLTAQQHCDLVLVMSVMPGFGGQTFDPVTLEKLAALRSHLSDDVLLEVDGGVNQETIGPCVAAGASLLVVGSAITEKNDYSASVASLNRLAAGAR